MYHPVIQAYRPVTQWDAVGAFDSAKDCEASAQRLFLRAQKEQMDTLAESFRCIPADWLKRKPSER